jgi:hypothetical protein
MLAAVILAGGLHAITRQPGAAATSCSASITRPLVFEYDSLSGLGTFSTGIVTLSCKAPEFWTALPQRRNTIAAEGTNCGATEAVPKARCRI